MDFKFGKLSATACIEQICGRLRQFVRDLPDEKVLSIDELGERIALTVLYEMNEHNLPVDPQLVIASAMGMVHAAMQTIAMCNQSPPPNASEIAWDETVH